MPHVILASASPARLNTLIQAGLQPDVLVSGADEDSLTAPTTADLVCKLAELKAASVLRDLPPQTDTVMIACDSMLDVEGQAYGKPVDAADARARWQLMRGGEGVLHTGHYLARIRGNEVTSTTRLASTTVHFADLTDAEIEAYVATGEPLRVAGAFTVDGLGGAFVTHIEGDYHNVVGISLPLVRTMCADLGLSWPQLWHDAEAHQQ
ncbi:MAG: Maf family protein [Propionibacteriaceae bacterium]